MELARTTRLARALRDSTEGAPTRASERPPVAAATGSGRKRPKAVLREVDWDVVVLRDDGDHYEETATLYDLKGKRLYSDDGTSAPVEAVSRFLDCRKAPDVFAALEEHLLQRHSEAIFADVLASLVDDSVVLWRDSAAATEAERERRERDLSLIHI